MPSSRPTAILPQRPGAWHLALGLLLSLASVGLIGWLDVLSGPDLGLAVFYLVPVTLAGWYLGAPAGVATSLAAFAAWLAADLYFRPAEEWTVAAWNGVTRLVIFSAGAWVAGRLHRDQRAPQNLNARLQDRLEEESLVARTDPVTGLPNRRAFVEVLDRELARCRRTRLPLALAFVDLDNFKLVNDTHGHGEGDRLLAHVARVLRAHLRPYDTAARMGGDEFCLLLWDTQREAAVEIAARLLAEVAQLGRAYPAVQFGASIGLYCDFPTEGSPEEVLARADALMYQSKRNGRGRLTVSGGGDAGPD